MNKTTRDNGSINNMHKVDPNDSVVFYRSFGTYSPIGRCWHLNIGGSVFTPSRRHIRKHAFLHLLKRVVRPEKQIDVHQRFLDRALPFTNIQRKGQSVPIAIGEQAYLLPDSMANGHFETVLTIPESELDPSIQIDSFGRRFIEFCAHLPEEDDRLFTGEVELIPPEGVSVISDVDDTIKVTNVADRRELLANTFTREFRSIEGMRDLYQAWAAAGFRFHYVSASPWPLYQPITEWLDSDGFPVGSVHLRHVRLTQLRKDKKKQHSFRSKRDAIERILRMFPLRHFIFCGDSGERDAELYADVARRFGDQVAYIAIRHIEENDTEKNGETRSEVLTALSQVDNDRWTLFRNPRDLMNQIPENLSSNRFPA